MVRATDSPIKDWVARRNLTAAQYQAEFNKWTGQGYRPSIVCAYQKGGDAGVNVRYYGVFIKGGPAVKFSVRHDLSEKDYQAWINSLAGQKLTPVYVSVSAGAP